MLPHISKRWCLLPLALCACDYVVPGNSYTVSIDPAFSEQERQEILNGIQDWVQKVPDLHLTLAVEQCSGVQTGRICMHRSTLAYVSQLGVGGIPKGGKLLGATGGSALSQDNAWAATNIGNNIFFDAKGDTGGYGGTDGAEIWISADFVQSIIPQFPHAWQSATAHEIGHGMGLLHHTGYYLMSPDIDHGSSVVQCDDIAQWYSIRFSDIPPCQNGILEKTLTTW